MKQKETENIVKKHPDAIAWEEWENSFEGQRCLEGIAKGKYLRNRLMAAFYAGRKVIK